MTQEENPIISSEELQEDKAEDCEIRSFPVQQYSVEDEGDNGSGKPINSSYFLRMVQKNIHSVPRARKQHVNILQ